MEKTTNYLIELNYKGQKVKFMVSADDENGIGYEDQRIIDAVLLVKELGNAVNIPNVNSNETITLDANYAETPKIEAEDKTDYSKQLSDLLMKGITESLKQPQVQKRTYYKQ